MRIWSLHPKYLDPQGLVALWRETLLAQKVLQGQTKGYRNHPQLQRFAEMEQPLAAIGDYLWELVREAQARGYNFDASKVIHRSGEIRMQVTEGQMAFEWEHYLAKTLQRSPMVYERIKNIGMPEPHPLFVLMPGAKAVWEKA